MNKITNKTLRAEAAEVLANAKIEGMNAEAEWAEIVGIYKKDGRITDKQFKMTLADWLKPSKIAERATAINAYIAELFEDKVTEIYSYEGKSVEGFGAGEFARICMKQLYIELIKHDRRNQTPVEYLTDWLSGLALNIDFNYCDIAKRLKSFGYSDKEINNGEMIDKWFSIVAFRMSVYFRKTCGVELAAYLKGLE